VQEKCVLVAVAKGVIIHVLRQSRFGGADISQSLKERHVLSCHNYAESALQNKKRSYPEFS
jgi:hypothetical protein